MTRLRTHMLHLLTRALVIASPCAACGANLTPPGTAADAGALACLPDLDGTITAHDLAPAFGVAATYLASGAPRATGGATSAGAPWDLSAPAADDTRVAFTAAPLTTQWYAGSFPGGAFVVPSDAAGTIDGVYALDDAAFWFYGSASHDPSPPAGVTLLPYVTPVALYRFPLADGDTTTATGVIAPGATLRGLPYQGQDVYEIHVEGHGETRLPDLAFEDALRVRTTVTVEPAIGAHVVRRQASFLFECFGEVARMTSADGEPSDAFTTAAEVRRLAL